MISAEFKKELMTTKTSKEFLIKMREYFNLPSGQYFSYGDIERLTDDEVYKHFDNLKTPFDLETWDNHSDPRPIKRKQD